ncbi:MAG: hypothetical protein ACP5NW_05605 [Candidatus Woesearchaeota archaeon]
MIGSLVGTALITVILSVLISGMYGSKKWDVPGPSESRISHITTPKTLYNPVNVYIRPSDLKHELVINLEKSSANELERLMEIYIGTENEDIIKNALKHIPETNLPEKRKKLLEKIEKKGILLDGLSISELEKLIDN